MIGSGSSVAKKLIWDALEITKSAMSYIGPSLGVNSQEDMALFVISRASQMSFFATDEPEPIIDQLKSTIHTSGLIL